MPASPVLLPEPSLIGPGLGVGRGCRCPQSCSGVCVGAEGPEPQLSLEAQKCLWRKHDSQLGMK